MNHSVFWSSRARDYVAKATALLCLAITGPGYSADELAKKHSRVCAAKARTIVHDPVRWREYLSLALRADRRELEPRRDGALVSISGSNPDANEAANAAANSRIRRISQDIPPHFTSQFIMERTEKNEPIGKIVRNDMNIAYNGIVIAELVNYNVTIDGLGSHIGLSCTMSPELYQRFPQ